MNDFNLGNASFSWKSFCLVPYHLVAWALLFSVNKVSFCCKYFISFTKSSAYCTVLKSSFLKSFLLQTHRLSLKVLFMLLVFASVGMDSVYRPEVSLPLLVITPTITHVNCYGGNTGAISITVTGGVPFMYVWTATNGGVVPPGQTNSQNLTGLVAGTYSVNALNMFMIPIGTSGPLNVTQPLAALGVTTSSVNISCNTTGSATANVTGGTSPYSYSWNTTPIQTTQTATGLAEGTYIVTVTDSKGCASTASATITQSGSSITLTTSQINVLCFGNSTGSATVNATGGTSPYTYSWNTSPVQTTATANGLSAGTYVVTVTDNNSCVQTATVTITQPAAALALTTSQINVLCFGNSTGSATVSATGGTSPYTYSWNTSPVQTTATANGLSAGTYVVTVTDNNSCVQTATVTITQPAQLVINSINSNSPICQGATLTFSTSASGGLPGYSYSWTGPDSFNSNIQNPSIANALPVASGTYSLIVSDNNSCTASASITVIVNPTPVVNDPADQSVCNGNQTTAVFFTGTGTSYTWTNNNISIGLPASGTGNINAFTATNLGSSTIVATIIVTPIYSNGGIDCPGSSQSFTITVYPTPVVIATPAAQTICSSTATSVALSSNVSGTAYTWSVAVNPIGSVTGALPGNGNIINQTLVNTTAFPATVTYTVTGTANGCNSITVDVVVTVNPTPVLSSPLTANVCSNVLFTYNPSSNTPGTTYTWTRAAVLGIQNLAASGVGTINETLINITGTPKTVNYIYTLTANGCTSIQNLAVTVYPLPILLSSLTPSAVCSNTLFSYIAVSSITGTTLTWVRSVVAGISNPAGSGTGNINEILINTTSSNVTVPYVYTLTVGGCINTVTVNATIKPTPVLSSTLTPTDICSNSLFSYNPESSTTGTSFNWSRFPVPGISNGPGSGTGNPNEILVNTTSNSISVTYVFVLQANGCPNTQNVVVIVKPTPTVTPITNQEFCNGSTTTVIAVSSPVSGSTFAWTNNNTSIGLAASGSGNIPSFTATNSTGSPISASITVTPTANGCPGTPFTFLISVNPTPLADVPANQVICNGAPSSAVVFTGTFATITWTNNHPEIGLAASGTGNIGIFTGINTGTDPIVATITVIPHFSVGGTGCDGLPITFTITVNPTPVVSPVSSQTFCANVSYPGISFATTATGGIPSFSWTSSLNVGFGTSGSGNIPSFVAVNGDPAPILATVSVASTLNGCTGGFSTFTVTVNPLPSVDPSDNQAVCNNGTTAVVNFTGIATSYTWTNNNTSIGLAASGTGNIGSFIATNPGSTPEVATITVTPVYTGSGLNCQGATKSFTITVNPGPIASITGTTYVCQNGAQPPVTFTGNNGTAPYTFTYRINSGAVQVVTTSSGNSVNINAPTGSIGVFHYILLSVSGASGCSGSVTDTATITVEDLPNATISGTTTVCQNTVSPQVTFTGSDGSAPYTFTYKINGGPDLTVSTVSGNSVTISAPTSVSGSFIYSLVSVSSSAGCLQLQNESITITINPTPNLVIANPQPVCSPATVDLTDPAITTGSTPGLVFSYWTDPGATNPMNTPTVAGNGTYYIKGTDPVTGCYDIKGVIVTVNSSPTLVITNPAPVCAPATVDLTQPAITAGSSSDIILKEYYLDSIATIVYTTPTTAEGNTYYIKGINAAGCFDIKPVVVLVYSSLGIPVFALGASSSICSGSAPITYTATATNSFTLTYSLDAASLAAGNTINTGTGQVTFAPAWTGTSQITATATGCGIPTQAIHNVIVNQSPGVTLVASNYGPVCEGTNITLTATNSGTTTLQTSSGASGTINQNIPESRATWAGSNIPISGFGAATIGAADIIEVSLDITHNDNDQLDIFLVSPSGACMLLSSDNGGNGNGYVAATLRTNHTPNIGTLSGVNTIISGLYGTEGNVSTLAPLTGGNGGNYTSAAVPQTLILGKVIDGNWQIRVFDDNNSGAIGRLVRWSLSITKLVGPGYTSIVNGPQTIGPVSYSSDSTVATSVVTPPAGTNIYTVTTTDGNGCSSTSNTVSIVVTPKPNPTILADYCIIRPKVLLTTSSTYATYTWSTGETTPSISVDIAGNYTVVVNDATGCQGSGTIMVAEEKVTDGSFTNFVAASPVFFTEYFQQQSYYTGVSTSGLWPEGYYAVNTSAWSGYPSAPQGYHTNFHGRDHTNNISSIRNFLMVNGSTTLVGSPPRQRIIWQQTVNIESNTDYYFSAWAMNLNPASPARLQFEVNGSLVGTIADLNTAPKPTSEAQVGLSNWVRFYSNPLWNSGSDTIAVIRIRNLNTTAGGNDFGLDDISFGTLASVDFTVAAANSSPLCSGNTLNLSSSISGGKNPITYSWTGPNGFTSNLANPVITDIAPDAGGTYVLSVIDAYNCPAETDTTIVVISPTPEIPDQTALICSGETFIATPVNGIPDIGTFVPAGTTFTWAAPVVSPPGSVTGASAATNQSGISQTLTNITISPATVTYTVVPIAGSCTGASFTVIVTVNPVATANAGTAQAVCANSPEVTLAGSIGGAATTGTWSGGTGSYNPNATTLNAVYTPSPLEISAGSVTLILTSNDPDGSGPCQAVNSTVVITINRQPLLSSTNVNASCYGASTGSIDLTVTDGTPNYSYAWTASNGGIVPVLQANNQDLNGLHAGTYSVNVVDSKSCSNTLSVTITDPDSLIAHENHATVPCAGGSASVTISASGGTAPYTGIGTFSQLEGTVVYTVTDSNGCFASISVTVTVALNTAPVISVCPVIRNFNGCGTSAILGPAYSTVLTSSSYSEFSDANNLGQATDNCAISSVTYLDVAIPDCPITVTRTWTLTDASGLSTSCDQTITVTDADSPVWSTLTGVLNRMIECSDAIGLSDAQSLFPVATDNCDADVSDIVKISGSFVPSSSCQQEGSYTNSWTVIDACGNTSDVYTQTIIVTDNTSPAWVTVAGALDQTLECSNTTAITAALAMSPTAADLCDSDVTNLIKVTGTFIPNGCSNAGSYTNSWTVTDECGNVSSVYTQVITLTDNTAPAWLTASTAIDVTVECNDAAGIAAAQVLAPVAADNCDADVSDIVKVSGLFVPAATCQQEGSFTNTWTVIDNCGNMSLVFTQVITIIDETGPLVYCPPTDAFPCNTPSFDPAVTGTAVAAGDCDINPVLSWDDAIVSGTCAGNYQIIRTWTATDACGNTSSCNQTIFVQDVIPPTISCPVSGTQNIFPNSGPVYIHPDNSWDATAIDDCSGVNLSVTLSGATISGPHTTLSGVTFVEGITIVTWTVSDNCGNSNECQFMVSLTSKPQINCPADISTFTDPGLCSASLDPGFPVKILGTEPVTYSWAMTGATSGFSGTGTITPNPFMFNAGITTITWIASNISGSDTCIQTITVVDNGLPTFTPPGPFTFCVENIYTADYYDPTMDIAPDRPEYYLFEAGNVVLNINPATFNDNCSLSCSVEIRWKINFSDGTQLPALPALYITGQPSSYGSDIQLPGSVTSNVLHSITYQIVDCSGNISAPVTAIITIIPRPDIIKQ